MNKLNATALVGGAVLALAVGCSKTPDESGAAPVESGAEGTPSNADEVAATAPGQTFTLNTSVEGGQLVVSVEPAAGYKINEDFPWLLAMSDVAPGGVAELTAEDASRFEEAGARFNVDGADYAAGDRVEASLRFAVCNDDVCITRTEDLAWDL